MEGYGEWVQTPERWRSKWGDLSTWVDVHKWSAGGHIYFWCPLYFFEDQKSKVMVVCNRFVKNIWETWFLLLGCLLSGFWNAYYVCCPGWFRSFIADYGVPLMVVLWTVISFSVPHNVPSQVPRRLYSPLAWDSESLHHWSVIKVN